MEEYKFVKSQKGKEKLVFKSYIYRHQKSLKNNHYFRCENRSCNGTAILHDVMTFNSIGGTVELRNKHCHAALIGGDSATQTLNEIKNRATVGMSAPSAIIEEVTQNIEVNAAIQMPQTKTIKQVVKKIKKKDLAMESDHLREIKMQENQIDLLLSDGMKKDLAKQDEQNSDEDTVSIQIQSGSNKCGMEEYQFVKSQKGKEKLVFKSYIYRHQKSLKDNHYFRCENSRCNGTAILHGVPTFNSLCGTVELKNNHCHGAVIGRDAAIQTLNEIKSQAIASMSAPSAIVKEATQAIDVGAAAEMPSTSAMKQLVRRIRKKGFSLEPDFSRDTKMLENQIGISLFGECKWQQLAGQDEQNSYDEMDDATSDHQPKSSSKEMEKYQFVKSQKGKEQLFLKGYIYRHHKSLKNNHYFRCENSGCNGTAILHDAPTFNSLSGTIELKNDHCHDVVIGRDAIIQTLNEIKNQAIANKTAPSAIVKEATEAIDEQQQLAGQDEQNYNDKMDDAFSDSPRYQSKTSGEEMEKYQFVKSQKGKEQLFYKGYIYRHHKSLKNNHYFRCENGGCNGTAILHDTPAFNSLCGTVELRNNHCHPLVFERDAAVQALNEIKNQVVASTSSTAIVKKAAQAIDVNAMIEMTSTLAVKQIVQRIRKRDSPEKPDHARVRKIPKKQRDSLFLDGYKQKHFVKQDEQVGNDETEDTISVSFQSQSRSSSCNMDKYWFVKSQKGKDKLVFKSYIYRHHKSLNNNHYFRCEDTSCNGTAILHGVPAFNSLGGTVELGNNHCHDALIGRDTAIQALNEIKNQALASTSSPSVIIEEVTQRFDVSTAIEMPSTSCVKRMVRRIRKKDFSGRPNHARIKS